MRAPMPGIGVSKDLSQRGGVVKVETYCARLSDREKALLQCGQTYGRS